MAIRPELTPHGNKKPPQISIPRRLSLPHIQFILFRKVRHLLLEYGPYQQHLQAQ